MTGRFHDAILIACGTKWTSSRGRCKDLRRVPQDDARRIFEALDELKDDLSGDVKRLTKFTPEFSLRVGVYRVLFEIEESSRVVVYRVRHRSKAYKRNR